MEFDVAFWRLKSFEIPDGSDPACESVRKVLARLLASRAVSLGELQTARDIVGRKEGTAPQAYLFLAAMFVSLRDGNTAFNPDREENQHGGLLADVCRREDGDAAKAASGELRKDIADKWDAAVAAAAPLEGDIVKRDARGNSPPFRPTRGRTRMETRRTNPSTTTSAAPCAPRLKTDSPS